MASHIDVELRQTLSPRARLVRVLLSGVVLVLLLFGTFWGEDDLFPFGPFKMYAGTSHLNDPVPLMKFEATTESGEEIEMRAAAFGLRPAEVEGQLDRVASNEALLTGMVRAYEDNHPDDAALISFRVKRGIFDMEDGRPVGYSEEVIAEWHRDE
jgi:hypothetical protein